MKLKKNKLKVRALGHQGDVCIFEVSDFPEDREAADQQTTNAILAYGEASGHAHQFTDVATQTVFRSKGDQFKKQLFIEPKAPKLTLVHGRARDFEGKEADHDYHNPLTLPGDRKYMTGIVEETDWISRTIRQVID